MKVPLPFLVWLVAGPLFFGCTEDVLPEPSEASCFTEQQPTYVNDVAPIIERTCAYGSCHLGSAPGLYDNYEGLLPDLESGRFNERVINLRQDPTLGMPPDYAPADRASELTPTELQTISCWLEAGFPLE